MTDQQSNLTPDQDQIASYQRKQQAQRRAAAQRPTGQRPAGQRPAQRQVAPTQVVEAKPNIAVIVLMTLLLAGLSAVSGWLVMQLLAAQEQQKTMFAAAEISQGKIAALENSLNSSAEDSNLSSKAIQIMLKKQESEIDKLWALANKKNRNAIAANAKTASSNKDKVATLNSNITKTSTKASSNTAAITSLKGSAKSQHASLTAQMASLKKSVSGAPAAIEKRIADNEQGIKAMDSTRLQLNKKMAKVEKGYNDFQLEVEDLQIEIDRLKVAMAR